MTQVEAELKRQPQGGGALVAWELVTDAESATGRADPVKDAGARATLDEIAAALAAALTVKDDYQTGQVLADQAGAGAVLTFTFSNTMSLIVILSTGTDLHSRADPFGGTPSATLGIRLDDGVPTYIPVQASSVKVYAPTGATVSVWGLRRT